MRVSKLIGSIVMSVFEHRCTCNVYYSAGFSQIRCAIVGIEAQLFEKRHVHRTRIDGQNIFKGAGMPHS